jgi:methane monooxygenase PmoA-like
MQNLSEGSTMRRQLEFYSAVIVVALLFAVSLRADEKLPLTIRLDVEQRNRTDALVMLSLPPSLLNGQPLRLIETTDEKNRPVAAQVDAAAARLWWVAAGVTLPGVKRTYRLEATTPAETAGVKVVDSDRTVEATFDGRLLLRYNKAHVEPLEGVNPKYGRSAHLHPVWTPGGSIVTDELPPDHLHQSGIFLAYTKTQFEGRDIDFWNLAGGKGRVRFKSLQGVASGPVFGQIRTEHEHVDLTAGDDKSEIGKTSGGKVALVESWDLRMWNVGLKSGYWLLDVNSSIRCASDSPLKLPEYHYGGMAIRAARPWVPKEVQFLTSEGDNRIKGNHTRPRWCEMHGLIDSKLAGVALMTHPSNFRFPEPLRIHPTMPYMVYTPSFLGDWEIRPGMPHDSHYRFVVHDGQLSAETLERLWRDYAEPLVAVAE